MWFLQQDSYSRIGLFSPQSSSATDDAATVQQEMNKLKKYYDVSPEVIS